MTHDIQRLADRHVADLYVDRSPEYDEKDYEDVCAEFHGEFSPAGAELVVRNGVMGLSIPVDASNEVRERIADFAAENLVDLEDATRVAMPKPSGKRLCVNLFYPEEAQTVTGTVDEREFAVLVDALGDENAAFALCYDDSEIEIFYEITSGGTVFVTDVLTRIEFWPGAKESLERDPVMGGADVPAPGM